VASEMSPQALTVKAHTKHRGPLLKVVAIKGDIRKRHNRYDQAATMFFLGNGYYSVGSVETEARLG
jgi:hypothetical protein